MNKRDFFLKKGRRATTIIIERLPSAFFTRAFGGLDHRSRVGSSQVDLARSVKFLKKQTNSWSHPTLGGAAEVSKNFLSS